MQPQTRPEPYRKLIIAVSIIIPLAVAALFGIKVPRLRFFFSSTDLRNHKWHYSCAISHRISSLSKMEGELLHEWIMKTCIGLSVCFLVMYVIYHMTSETTHFGGTGLIRYVYLFILATHIVLSVVIIPMVLIFVCQGTFG
jgi:putative membrane protein